MGGFIEILKQAFKIFMKNGKLILFITILFALANTTISLSYLFSTKFILNNFSNKIMNLKPVSTIPTSPELSPLQNSFLTKHGVSDETRILSLRLSETDDPHFRLHSASSHWLHIFVIVFVVFPIDPILSKFSPFTVITAVLVTILYFYLSVVWTLAIVVSVLEEKSGLEALWKASVLVKGLKRKGFLLEMLFGGLYLAVFLVLKAIFGPNLAVQVMIGVKILRTIVSISITTLIGVFSLISFTVLYFEGKKMNDNNVIEMQGSAVEYTKVPASFSSSDTP